MTEAEKTETGIAKQASRSLPSGQSPIGLFDSGVGGLTVAHALHTLLPREQLVYFGDTAHLPYGDKSKETIRQYSLGIADFLLEQGCKLILIACNSASANAYMEVKEHVGDRALVMNVIDPVVRQVAELETRHIGVIGTKATVESGTYQEKIAASRPTLEVSALATPLFVPMIEEGFVFDDISNAIIRAYLGRKDLAGIDSLILGCTHYPIIRNQISRFMDFQVNVLDTAHMVALAVEQRLEQEGLLASRRRGKDHFYISDYTPAFGVIANMFFNEKITLEKRNIWAT